MGIFHLQTEEVRERRTGKAMEDAVQVAGRAKSGGG
jgi:hypothetical protein